MLVTIKTLSNTTFKIEITPTDSIKEVKEKIHKEKGDDYKPELQKLILLGKVLEDSKTVGEYNIVETSSLVCFAAKPKATPGASTSSAPAPAAVPTPAPTPAPVAAPVPTPAPVAVPAPVVTPAAAPVVAPAPVIAAETPVSDPNLVIGEQYEQTVQEMMSMGFPRSQIIAAMRASFNNPDRAMEYLLSGQIPSIDEGESEEMSGDEGRAGESGTVPAGEDPLSFLRSQPQFAQMRALLQQNPSLLAPLLQQLAQSNPQLLTLINEHQSEFYNMINEPMDSESSSSGGSTTGATPAGQPPASGQHGGRTAITVTPAEREAIDRLKALGFPEGMCVQAYFACEKNENLAANFLLSQGDDE